MQRKIEKTYDAWVNQKCLHINAGKLILTIKSFPRKNLKVFELLIHLL